MTRFDEIQARHAAATVATSEIAPGYLVADDGTVWSLLSNWRGYGARQLAASPDADGYLWVRITVDGVRRKLRVHRLVAEAFLPPKQDGQQLRHLDGDKTNNRADNLAWGTAADNAADRERHGRTARGSANGFSKLSESDVVQIRSLYAEGGVTHRDLARQFGVHQATIGVVLQRKWWRHVEA